PGHDLEVDAHEHLRPVTPVVGQVRAGQRQAAHIDKRVASARVTTSAWSRLTAADATPSPTTAGAASTRLATLTQRCAERMEMRCRLRYHTAADDAASA